MLVEPGSGDGDDLEACLVELAADRGIVDVAVGGDRAGGCEDG